jgi:riboflavin kinase/FMN adenylyltransferase
MNIFESLAALPQIKNPVVTIGTFDGVHLGHQKILEQLKLEAKAIDGETVLLTFHPHPRVVLFPNNHGIQLLQSMEEKFQALEENGLENIIVLPFTEVFSNLTAEEFIRTILFEHLHCKKIVIGYDHQFGRNREGNINYLKAVSKKYNFEVIEIPAKSIDEVNISSTKIRESLLRGDVETAKLFLSRPYELNGTVVKGDQIGRTIGFPTANIEVNNDSKIIPVNGVYAVSVRIANDIYFGMMNIGVRPTVEKGNIRKLEVHLFDFNTDIYYSNVQVLFESHVRDEKKFANLDELKNAIKQDENFCRNYFSLPLV